MSYTNGGQTIDKSMNGIITFDTGGGVVIEGDTITAPVMNVTNFTATNFTTNNLTVNTNATINGTSTFNTSLPTSTITTTTSTTQIAPIAVLNTLYGRLATAVTNTWLSSNVFNAILPTSTIATSSSVNDFITRTIANIYYGQLTTGATNTWLSSNVFNAILPTSTLTGAPTATQIAPYSMLASVLAPIVTGGYARLTTVDNTFTNNNTFGGTTTTLNSTNTNINGICQITGPQTTSTADAQLTVRNSVSPTANTIQFACNLGAGGYNPIVQLGDSAIFSTFGSGTSKLVLTSWSSNAVGIRIEAPTSSVTIRGTTTNVNSTNTNINGICQIKAPQTGSTATNALVIENTEASPSQINFLLNAVATTANPNVTAGDDVIFSNGGILNLTTSSATAVGIRMSQTDIQTRANTTTLTGTILNNDITTTNVNSTTLAVSGSTATTFVNLPSTTTTFTTATANQFITRNIGDTLYLAPVTGNYARLSTVDNSFTNNNTFGGTTTRLSSTNNIVQSVVSGASALPPFIVRNANTTGVINFLPNATGASLNPIVGLGDCVIASGPAGVPDGLTLTADSTTRVGIRIIRTGFVDVRGITTTIFSNATAVTSTPSLRVSNSSNTTFEINMTNNATALSFNPIVQAGDNVISSGSNSGVTATSLVLTTASATNGGIRIDGITAQASTITQPATDYSTRIATTAYVKNLIPTPNLMSLFSNVGIGGSGLIPMKAMTFDPITATGAFGTTGDFHLTAIELNSGQLYTGITCRLNFSTATATLRLGIYTPAGALVVSTPATALTATAGFYSFNFSATYTPTTGGIFYIGHFTGGTGSVDITGSPLAVASNPAVPPTTALMTGRYGRTTTKPATFPTTINGLAKSASNIPFWYGIY